MLKRDTRYNKEQYSEGRMLSKRSERKNDYGWKKDWKELREEKDERIFFQVVKKMRNEYQPKINLLKEK
jgi:N-acetyl-anhydromuramyl-L-alanine amidase AmpD